jgi:hypothetical protein
MVLCPLNGLEDLVGHNHGHAAEVRYQMLAMGMAGKTTFRTLFRIAPSQW